MDSNGDTSPLPLQRDERGEADTASPHTPPTSSPTIVGIGASAGGLSALKAFFHHVPAASGLAFVVVVHLAPEHESHLADLLRPHVRVPVLQVDEETALRPDHVYVIPPGANLSAVDTHLRLSDLEERRRERAPIDHFFRTLARTHDGHAVGVVLTGTGADGTLGLKEVKAKGGLTVVQDPAEAEYDGMPQSAIATGLVDLVLPLAEIPAAILRYAATRPRVPVPASETDLGDAERRLLHDVFAQLRARTGRDFSRYKRSTILRRIRRRMQLRAVEELPAYLAVLREEPGEVRELADDLLVTVTNFFRDAEVFEALERDVVPRLFEGKGPDDDVRVWSVGCATGEEAYSLAILLLEEAARRSGGHEALPHLQVFASDLHEHSLARAREGVYPGDIAADVSPERLSRFFHREDGGYRIRKEVRELVVFAPHNLLGDPPFSRLDLIACRNVMIYLQRDVQRDVIELFHYALNPGGILTLGTSETIDGSDFFQSVDKRACVWRKRNVPAPEPRLPVFPLVHRRLSGALGGDRSAGEPVVYGALHQRVVERYAPPSALVSPDDEVVHLSEHAGRYLVHPGGEPTTSVFKLVRKELRVELRTALLKARQYGQAARSKPLPVQFDGHAAAVVLDVRPAYDPPQEGFCLVIFDERAGARSQPATNDDGEAQSREIEAELDLSQQRLQAIIERYETGQEELKAANEELQSSNEELRSTLEELETSKEELQSMNEELQTVNQENQHKVEELAQLSGDLQSLMAATDIATIFLDRELRIMRFTPRVGELFNVRPSDRGRPLADFTHRLGYEDLLGDARRVLDRLASVEREVEDHEGRWYLTRVLPYRSADDRIEGVVITFVDVTERRELERALLRATEEERRRVGRELHDGLGQHLAATAYLADGLAQRLGAEGHPAAPDADEVRDLVRGAIAETRMLSQQLMPLDLSARGLGEALRGLTRSLEEVYGLAVTVEVAEGAVDLGDETAFHLYRIAQEALNNAARHADAAHVHVAVRPAPEGLALVVRDDGRGIAPEVLEARPGLGLRTMRHRAEQIGARLTVRPLEAGGTEVRCVVPYVTSDT
jgi:two-component system CheB/CheR fusion protein